MKLIAVIKNSLILLAVLLLNSVSFVGQSAAMSTMSHEMNGMNHSSSDTTSCNTICHTAVINKEEIIVKEDGSEDDTDPAVPLNAQNQSLLIDEKSITQRLYAAEIKPPPKIPIYILYGAFRA